jgi:chitosanase
MKLIVKAKKLNKRSSIPAFLPDADSIAGTVFENYIFEGEEVTPVPNPSLGKWYRDRDNYFYWGGALNTYEEPVDEHAETFTKPDNEQFEKIPVTPAAKKKIEQVVNVFETGKAEGDYADLSVFADYSDPETHTRIRQVTFGRSQTTEFGHLKELIQQYIEDHGKFGAEFLPYMNHLGKKPSLETDMNFRQLLKKAGKEDPIMKSSQDSFFDAKYYHPAYNWFTSHGFELPLTMLVTYDSFIHSGTVLGFLLKRFTTAFPVNGGNEKEWTANYVNARHNWLTNHKEQVLRNTNYRTACFKEQIAQGNWDLKQPLKAHGVVLT